jgi:hypothetical protein
VLVRAATRRATHLVQRVLNIVDDGQSYDIFSHAAQALRQPGSPLLGGLPVQQIIGTGVSQSAMRLVPYINSFQALAHLYDGFFVHSRGRSMPPIEGVGVFSDQQMDPISTDVDVPVFLFQTEGDMLLWITHLRGSQTRSTSVRGRCQDRRTWAAGAPWM